MAPERAATAARTAPVPAPQTQAPLRSFAHSLPMALLRAREAVMRHFRAGLRAHDVTEQQWRVLRALGAHEALEATELAARTCLLPSSLSRILPELEARGLIARRQVRSDLRRSRIALTAEGARLLAAHAPHSERVYRTIEERFGAARLRELMRLLEELETASAGAGTLDEVPDR